MTPLSYEDGFHLRLGRLTHAVAALDVNIGFSLKWFAQRYAQDVANVLDGAKPMKLRLDRLEALTQQPVSPGHSAVSNSLAAWFKRAYEVRALRNDYVHARWSLQRIEAGTEPFVEYIPLTWETDPAALPKPIRVTFTEFDQQIAAIHKLSRELFDLLAQHFSE